MQPQFMINVEKFESPFATLFLGTYEKKACFVGLNDIPSFFKQSFFKIQFENSHSELTNEFKAYTKGSLKKFSIPLHFFYGTAFQQKVWDSLRQIPYAETRSYHWLACQANSQKAYRAAGSANAKNPLPIILPCHRVIQKNGNLGNYTGGSHIKLKLLSHEETHAHSC